MSKTTRVMVVIAFLAMATLIWLQQSRSKRLMAEAAALRDQLEQVTVLRGENERLARQSGIANERAQADASELARLRGQVTKMRQLEQEFARVKAERDRLAKPAQSATSEAQEPETPEIKLRRAKSLFGRDLGMALILAANSNDGNVLPELRGPLFDMVERLSAGSEYEMRAKQFEPVYTGSLRDVKDVSATVLAREKQPMQRPDGQWVRLYVLADGSSQYISAPAADGFAAREQELWPKP